METKTQAQQDSWKLDAIVDLLKQNQGTDNQSKMEKRRKINKILEAGLGKQPTNSKLWSACEYLFDGIWDKDDFDHAIAGRWEELEVVDA
ncbi:hypothetical protein [Vibrio ishigakensis]|uniref:hypothetical protein n=1 Tax=Vibrio ishigakensis TaxID=1481914 RepID=UPI0021C44424|nr:hypothetical protein [Vibrio ishigakensis]